MHLSNDLECCLRYSRHFDTFTKYVAIIALVLFAPARLYLLKFIAPFKMYMWETMYWTLPSLANSTILYYALGSYCKNRILRDLLEHLRSLREDFDIVKSMVCKFRRILTRTCICIALAASILHAINLLVLAAYPWNIYLKVNPVLAYIVGSITAFYVFAGYLTLALLLSEIGLCFYAMKCYDKASKVSLVYLSFISDMLRKYSKRLVYIWYSSTIEIYVHAIALTDPHLLPLLSLFIVYAIFSVLIVIAAYKVPSDVVSSLRVSVLSDIYSKIARYANVSSVDRPLNVAVALLTFSECFLLYYLDTTYLKRQFSGSYFLRALIGVLPTAINIVLRILKISLPF